jgi:cathepsin L
MYHVFPVILILSYGLLTGFSTVSAIEGAVAIYTRQLNELSVQELIDCVTQNEGCSGGDFEYSFDYSVSNGLQSSSSYRFIQRPTGTCNLDTKLVASRITAYGQIAMCNTQSLLQVVATRPVAVAIDGSCDSFIHYGGGIYTESCGNVRLPYTHT